MRPIIILFLLCLLPAPLSGAEGEHERHRFRGYLGIELNGSTALADDGIDTTVVPLDHAKWADLGSALDIHLNCVLTNLLDAGDSVQVGIDLSAEGTIWTEVFTLGNDDSNLNGAEHKDLDMSGLLGRFLRFRIKNVTGGAATMNTHCLCVGHR